MFEIRTTINWVPASHSWQKHCRVSSHGSHSQHYCSERSGPAGDFLRLVSCFQWVDTLSWVTEKASDPQKACSNPSGKSDTNWSTTPGQKTGEIKSESTCNSRGKILFNESLKVDV